MAPEVVAHAGRLVRHFGVFLLASVVVSVLPLPWRVATIAFLIGAAVTGVRAVGAVLRARLRGGLVPMLTVGLLVTGVLATTTLSSLAMWSIESEQQDCLAGALTQTAQAACAQEYQDAVTQWTSGLLDGSGSAG